jgi:hypothetical protein
MMRLRCRTSYFVDLQGTERGRGKTGRGMETKTTYLTLDEELARAEIVAKQPLPLHESNTVYEPRASDVHMLGLFTKVEERHSDPTKSPPCGIAGVVGAMDFEKFGVIDMFDASLKMPSNAEWKPSCARWSLDPKGGGGDEVLRRNAEDAVESEIAIAGFRDFVKHWQTAVPKTEFKREVTIVGDSLRYDFASIDYWSAKGEPCELGSRILSRPQHPALYASNLRKNKDPYDPIDADLPLKDALKELGFKSDHDPINECIRIYVRCYVMTHYDTIKTLQYDETLRLRVERRKFDVKQLRAEGIYAGSPKLGGVVRSPSSQC